MSKIFIGLGYIGLTTRTPIVNCEEPLIKFKLLYPTFEVWKSAIKSIHNEITDIDIKEQEFNSIQARVANSYLRYSNDEKNKSYLSEKYSELYNIRKRQEELYNMKFEDLLKQTSTNTQKLFTVNRTELDDVDDKFLDNKVLSELVTVEPKIRSLKEYKELLSMKDPKIAFLNKLASVLVHPMQPEQKGRLWP